MLWHDHHADVDAFDATAKFQKYVTHSIFVVSKHKKASHILLIEGYYDRFRGFDK